MPFLNGEGELVDINLLNQHLFKSAVGQAFVPGAVVAHIKSIVPAFQ